MSLISTRASRYTRSQWNKYYPRFSVMFVRVKLTLLFCKLRLCGTMPANKDQNTLSPISKNDDPRPPVYEGYTFFKADPLLGQTATWNRVERTSMRRSQTEYITMTHKRAAKNSAVQQYQKISSNTRRAHINQLIDEQRRTNPRVEWSCVYVKEHASKTRNTRRGDYETISMDVIITQRPLSTTHPRIQMGNPVGFGLAFRSSLGLQCRDRLLMPSQNRDSSQPTVEGQSRFALSGENPRQKSETELARGDEKPRESTTSTATVQVPSSPAFSAANSSDIDSVHSSGWSSEDSHPDSDFMVFGSSDESSGTDNPDDSKPKYQVRPKSTLEQEDSAVRRTSSYGAYPRAKSYSRSYDRRLNRTLTREQVKVPASPGPIRSGRARSRDSTSARIYHMQLINDNEIRSRLLDYREASIGHREKRLKRTFFEAHQLEVEPLNENSPVCRCTCRCAAERREVE